MNFKNRLFVFVLLFVFLTKIQASSPSVHPRIYVSKEDRQTILNKIENEEWAKESWNNLLQRINPFVTRHQSDPTWIVSRLAMYWGEGEHYTQCYIKKQNWDYGEGNAPVPTVRLPGMRIWNDYVNVPLEDRTPYNKTGDMWGISRSSGDPKPVLVPYKKSGHMIRRNNAEILELAEQSAFAYYITQDEKYAKFSSDILWTWLLGTYYMNPPLDPEKSTGGPGGYAPGGIMGYYDYEVIHDDRQQLAAATYDFVHDYMCSHPSEHLQATGKSTTELAGIVFKRFIDIGLMRGGSRGNWNVNRYKNLINSILVLEPNEYYVDGKGRDYYIPFYTEKNSKYYACLPEIMKNFDKATGLWPESPGYASGIIPTVLSMGVELYKNGVNTLKGNPIILKAAMANLGWLDARGNLVVFGDMRGGPSNISAFESLLTYDTWEGDIENVNKVAKVIAKGIEQGQYNRNKSDVFGICFHQELPQTSSDLPFYKAAYSRFHRHIIMKNGNDQENGMMFTLYGGAKGSHLSANGLAMQIYGKGWALAPDAAAYESYWSPDHVYHQSVTGVNTIVPGYSAGPININAMDPAVDSTGFYNKTTTSDNCSFTDVSAQEKRRLVAMVRTSPTTGYYVDIFRSDQPDNDYIYHNLGNTAVLKDENGKPLNLKAVDDLGTQYSQAYSYFKNQRKVAYANDFWGTWSITTVTPGLNVDVWMMGQDNREIYLVDAPPTTLRDDITPGQVNKSPQSTPTMILRQNGNNANVHPFVGVFEAYNEGEKSIREISKIAASDNFVSIAVASRSGAKQYICNAIDNATYTPTPDLTFQGTFGIASENSNGFQYLYLGKGKILKKGNFSIEAVGGDVSAELKLVDGNYYYSADKPVRISLKSGKTVEYNAGYQVAIN